MRKIWMLITALMFVGTLTFPTHDADAFWGYRRYRRHTRANQYYKPHLSMSMSGGVHFIDTYGASKNNRIEEYTLAYAILELGGHLWVHPNLSLDLNLGSHILTRPETNDSQAYLSIKPGIRIRRHVFYARAALDLSISGNNKRHKALLFGALLGVGIRVPLTFRTRFIAELDYQILASPGRPFVMPFYGQIGIEMMF